MGLLHPHGHDMIAENGWAGVPTTYNVFALTSSGGSSTKVTDQIFRVGHGHNETSQASRRFSMLACPGRQAPCSGPSCKFAANSDPLRGVFRVQS